MAALAQEPATQNPPSMAGTASERQNNAASASQDNSATSGDQVTKPAGAKSTTLIGCLSGPNEDGKYMLTSMQHRTGVQVLGPDDLKKDSGSKVKLTGSWEPGTQQPHATGKEARRFQITGVEVLAQHCTPPVEQTPVSKKKQRQHEAQQEQKQQQQ